MAEKWVITVKRAFFVNADYKEQLFYFFVYMKSINLEVLKLSSIFNFNIIILKKLNFWKFISKSVKLNLKKLNKITVLYKNVKYKLNRDFLQMKKNRENN